MIEDRRTYPRAKESVTLRVVLPEGELALVTTDIGPTGAFFAGIRKVAPGAAVDVLVRPQGLKIATVRIHAEVVRVVAPGGPHPPGFAVRWLWALSEAGPEPILAVLRRVLRIQGLRDEHLDAGRRVRLDFPPIGGRFQFRVVGPAPAAAEPMAPRDGGVREEIVAASSRSHGATAWSPRATLPRPVTGVGAAVPPSSSPPVSSASAGPPPSPPPRSTAQPTADVDAVHAPFPRGATEAPDAAPAPVWQAPLDPAVRRTRSGAFSTYERDPVAAVPGRRRTSDVVTSDDLRPIGRRPVPGRAASGHFDPDHQHTSAGLAAPQASRAPSGVFDAELHGDATRVGAAPGRPPAHAVAPSPSAQAAARASGATAPTRPVSGAFDELRSTSPAWPPAPEHTTGGAGRPPRTATPGAGTRRPASDLRDSPFYERSQVFGYGGQVTTGVHSHAGHSGAFGPAAVDLPVTFEAEGRLIPARMISAAALAVEIVVDQALPALDDRVVVHVPVDVEGRWRAVMVVGKLMRAPKPRADGATPLVLAVERVQEGRHAGAYARFVEHAPRAAAL